MAVLGLTVPVSVRSYAVTRRFAVWSWRRRIIQIGRIDGATLVNVHLTPHGQPAEKDRAREVSWLLRRVTGVDPLVVGGDFNDIPSAAIFARLSDADLRDAWPTAHPRDIAGGLTNWSGRRNRPPMRRLDYLWVSASVDVTDVEVPAYGAEGFERFPAQSDHLPVTATLGIGPRGDG
jgi:endonuclease/exonuclease/phosphatase family metal-dependent hydrolase